MTAAELRIAVLQDIDSVLSAPWIVQRLMSAEHRRRLRAIRRLWSEDSGLLSERLLVILNQEPPAEEAATPKEAPVYREYLASGGGPSTNLAPTEGDIEGPFYKPGADFCDGELCQHPDMEIRGRVLRTDGTPVANAVLDFWQADHYGFYDNEGYKFRGKLLTGPDGIYDLHTVTPGCYAISETEFRCPHIHVKVTADGLKPLTTQLYFMNGDHNDTDRWFDPARVIQFASRTVDKGKFDFVLAPAGEAKP